MKGTAVNRGHQVTGVFEPVTFAFKRQDQVCLSSVYIVFINIENPFGFVFDCMRMYMIARTMTY